jgi:hypothetical protein
LKLKKIVTEIQDSTPFVTVEDRAKADVIRMLVRPVDELAAIFMNAFKDHEPILSKVDVTEGVILITFMLRRPMSDSIRETVFRLYNTQWGGKPEDLECVYKEAAGMAGYGYATPPTILYITVRPHAVMELVKESKAWHVLDFDAWVRDLPPKHWPGTKSKHKVLVKDRVKKHSVTVFENGLSGEPIPTVRHALFKV